MASVNAVVLYEADDQTHARRWSPPRHRRGLALDPGALHKLAKESAGTAWPRTSSPGCDDQLFGLRARAGPGHHQEVLAKKAEVLEANLRGFAAGEEWAKDHAQNVADKRLQYTSGEPMLLMSGNELSAVAALHAGCRFFAGYPITPSSEILHFLSEWMPRVAAT